MSYALDTMELDGRLWPRWTFYGGYALLQAREGTNVNLGLIWAVQKLRCDSEDRAGLPILGQSKKENFRCRLCRALVRDHSLVQFGGRPSN